MTKERNIQILEYKISEIDRLMLNYDKYNINKKKKINLKMKKLKYEDQLADIQYS